MSLSKTMSVAATMMVLFAGHSGAYGTHGEPYQEPGKLKWEIKKTARTIRDPVTKELWEAHLKGERPLGVISIKEDNTCSWGSIDIDKYDHDLVEIANKVEKSQFPLVPCVSKSGGLHLFLFLENSKPAHNVQATLRDMAAALGLAGSEIFPKQTQILADRGDLGSWMVMPYFGSTYGGKLKDQVGLKKTGATMTIDEFLKIAMKSRVSDQQFVFLDKRKANGKVTTFTDGPPCLQHLAEIGFPEGMRNNALFHMGIYFRRKEPRDWKQALEEANQLFMKPPLSSEELSTTMRSLAKKEYEYTCKVEPMCSHCDAMVCKTRRFGIGDDQTPLISGLSKLDTRPAIWFVDVGDTRLELSTDQLMTYSQFQRVCMEEINQLFMPMKQTSWNAVLSEAMQTLIIVDAPEEISAHGRFKEALEEFLVNRELGERVEDLLRGRPWENEDEQRYYFTIGSLQKYLERENIRDERGSRYTRGQISQNIERMKGSHTRLRVKNQRLRVWWVPASEIVKPATIDPPDTGDTPI